MTTEVAASDVWVRAAMIDDEMVVRLILRLKHAPVASPAVIVSLRWGSRRPRSRTNRCSVGPVRKDGHDSTYGVRASPTTPLSWSGGSGIDCSDSPSVAAGDGFQYARRQTTCSTTAGSRSKTFSGVKDEEDVLLKERRQLKKAMASLRATHMEQTSRNETMKRIKLDLNSNCTKIPVIEVLDEDDSSLNNGKARSRSTINKISSPVNTIPSKDSCRNLNKTALSGRGSFMLPDLNAIPSDEDSGNILYGTS